MCASHYQPRLSMAFILHSRHLKKTAEVIGRTWPENVRMHSPVRMSQIFAVESSEAVSTCVPSAENTADLTNLPCHSWPAARAKSLKLFSRNGFHTKMALS